QGLGLVAGHFLRRASGQPNTRRVRTSMRRVPRASFIPSLFPSRAVRYFHDLALSKGSWTQGGGRAGGGSFHVLRPGKGPGQDWEGQGGLSWAGRGMAAEE